MAISQAIAGNIKPLRGGRFNPMLSRTSARRGVQSWGAEGVERGAEVACI